MRQTHIGKPRGSNPTLSAKPDTENPQIQETGDFHHVIVERNKEHGVGDNVDTYLDRGYEIVKDKNGEEGRRLVTMRIPMETHLATQKAVWDQANAVIERPTSALGHGYAETNQAIIKRGGVSPSEFAETLAD